MLYNLNKVKIVSSKETVFQRGFKKKSKVQSFLWKKIYQCKFNFEMDDFFKGKKKKFLSPNI